MAAGLLVLVRPWAGDEGRGCGTPAVDYAVAAEHPHSAAAFVQGLVFAGPRRLVEGSGRYGQSRLWVRSFPEGRELGARRLSPRLFGEGVTVLDGRVYQLTWKAGRALVYRLRDLVPVAEHEYVGEGWGLTHDGSRLIMSDGSHRLVFRDPLDFSVLGRLAVRGDDGPVRGLNELEYVAGAIWANVWPTDCVVRIDAAGGGVTGWLDLGPLRRRMGTLEPAAVANGIAYHSASGHLVVTGKLWPKLFELRLEGGGAPAGVRRRGRG